MSALLACPISYVTPLSSIGECGHAWVAMSAFPSVHVNASCALASANFVGLDNGENNRSFHHD